MGFVERVLDEIAHKLRDGQGDETRDAQLHAAQQALKWATDPQAFANPLEMIEREAGWRATPSDKGPSASAGCLADNRPVRS